MKSGREIVAGTSAADWWAQDTVGGRASGDTAATARIILAGIDDGNPRTLDALPVCDLSGANTRKPLTRFDDCAKRPGREGPSGDG